MALVSLTNDFHGTTVRLRCETLSHIYGEVTIYPTPRQIQRTKRTLCPCRDCTCSGDAGNRGRQSHNGKRLIVDTSSLYR